MLVEQFNYSSIYKRFAIRSRDNLSLELADWFARKNSRRLGYIYNNIYYLYNPGLFDY